MNQEQMEELRKHYHTMPRKDLEFVYECAKELSVLPTNQFKEVFLSISEALMSKGYMTFGQAKKLTDEYQRVLREININK